MVTGSSEPEHANFERWRPAIRWNADRYLRRFARIARAGGVAPSWNMAAFLHSTGWFCYRRMGWWAALNFFGPFFLVLAVIAASQPGGSDSIARVLVAVYVFGVFVLLPMFADSIYYRALKERHADSQATPRPPSIGTLAGAVALGGAGFLIAAAIIVPAYGDYTPRAKISEAVLATWPTRNAVTEFHAEHRRLPSATEADRFRVEPPAQWTQSVVYEAAQRRIVVTLREIQDGKRFALYAAERDGQLVWTCRTIDLEKKYLPASCRE